MVPVVRSTKRPFHDDWNRRTYAADDFDETVNIGIQIGKGIVDIDLDCQEAISAARLLMPATRTHGRRGKPTSHYWFTCLDIDKSRQFKDLDGTMLLEVRAGDGALQTVVPPSLHESGEDVVWEHDRLSAKLSKDELLLPVRATAIATLFARHWPTGNRHYAAGPLAGFLLRLGFDAQWTEQIIKAAATVAKDDEVSDRARVARDTASKHARGEKVTGAPKLAEHFGRGDELAARVYQWMEREGDELLDKLNAKHFVVALGADVVVGTEEDGALVHFQKFQQFRDLYHNQSVGKHKLGEWYLAHREHRRFRRVVFAPPPLTCHDEDYNTWRGFAYTPDPNPQPEARCQKYLQHIFRVICGGERTTEAQDYFEYLLDVCALTVQMPGLPTGVAVVLRGDQGSGKGTFVTLFGSLFGPHYIQVDKQDHVTGKFNQHLSGKIVLFADEAVWAGSKQQVGALRRLVTERTLTIERKYLDAVQEPNCVHLFMATNEEWVWPAALKERRGFILDVPKMPYATQAYFNDIYTEWENGGAEAFLAFCLARKVPGNRLRPLPKTRALEDQQKRSLDPLMQWWLEKLEQGDLGHGIGHWPEFIPSSWLHQDYLQVTGLSPAGGRRTSEMRLVAMLEALLPPSARRGRRSVNVNTARYGEPVFVRELKHGWYLPPLKDCRKHFDTVTGLDYHWPDAEPTPQVLPDMGEDA